MAVYAAGQSVAYNALPAGGIEQVSSLPTVGEIDHLYYLTVPDGTHEVGLYYFDGVVWKSCASGGEGGTNDYNDLVNKPRLNGIELAGNKSYTMMDIAQASNTYTKVQVDTLIASAQKVYLSDSVPTPVNNVGLYYVDTTGTGDSYEIYLVDTARNVAHLGSAGISLAGYQKEQDFGLETLNKTVVGGINELKYRIDNLPSGGTITMNGFENPSPTFYAPETSGTYNQVLVSRGANAAPEWVSGADSGTKVKLNGSSTVATNAAFYAPPSGGIAGYILKSQGEGLPPTWEEPGSADGAKMQLNGALTDVTGEKVKIYAPDTAGTAGQVLTSNGIGAPIWADAKGKMTLNGSATDVTEETVKIYAPNNGGTTAKQQVLVANGTNVAPDWKNSLRTVSLTKAEYAALSETEKKDVNVAYIITDDDPSSNASKENYYGTCATSEASQIKQVTSAGYELKANAIIVVKFANKNTAADPMLDINSTGYKPIIFKGASTMETAYTWRAGSSCTFMFDGSNYILLSEQVTTESIIYDILHSQSMYDAMYPVGMTVIQATAPVVWDGCTATWEQDTSGRYIAASSATHAIGSTCDPQAQNIMGKINYQGDRGNVLKYTTGCISSSGGTHYAGHNTSGNLDMAAESTFDASKQSLNEPDNPIYKAGLVGDERLRPATNFYGIWTRTA